MYEREGSKGVYKTSIDRYSMSRKKKIGIVTFWESNDNYGQQLQCWALQQYLRKRGYDAFLIRSFARLKKNTKWSKRIKQTIKNHLSEILFNTSLAYYPWVYRAFKSTIDKEGYRRRFPLFRKTHLSMGRIYYLPADLINNPPVADAYITGSDQVWNYSLPAEVFGISFLHFGSKKTKRIAYAPSIAHNELSEDIKPVIKKYLQSFQSISVREASGVQLIQELGFDVEHVLDPSMLLTADDYLNLAKDTNSKDNVFIYSINYESANEVPFAEIQQYAIENNLPIIVTPGSGYLPAKELFEGVEYSYATIYDWIQHIAHSELVVTASFHGIVFAILLHRSFMYTPLQGTLSEGNQRVLDMLCDLGLEDRIWKKNENNCATILSSSINWDAIDAKLNRMRKQSNDYLNKALEQI